MATTNKLSLAWTGDYESLKQFVYETFKLEGSWSQPGGDRKLFTFEDSTILWKKNQNLLSFNGSRANDFKNELCKCICGRQDDILGPVDMHNTSEIHSSKSSGLYMDIENIKQNQLVNVEAIRSLSDSVLHITSVISKFQDYMGKNKTHLHEGPSTGSIKHNENSENGNQVIAQLQDPIEIDGHDSFVSDQLTNPMGNNEAESISQLDDSSEAPSSMTDETLIDRVADCFISDQYVDSNVIEKPEAVVHQETYAQVAKSSPKTCKSNEKPSMVDKPDKPGNISQNHLIQRSTDVDGFIGVDQRRKRIKKFFLSGIHESVKENQIWSYLEQRNITPTHISLFRSQRRGTRSAKVHIPSSAGLLVQSDSFWPKFVRCRPWQPINSRNSTKREIKINTTHNGKYSTYV